MYMDMCSPLFMYGFVFFSVYNVNVWVGDVTFPISIKHVSWHNNMGSQLTQIKTIIMWFSK